MSFLPDAESFQRLVDGSTRGGGPAAARAALGLVAMPYAAVVRARNAAYDAGLFPILSAPVPVVSIGNLTLGGTGKTPLVAWVARALHRAGQQPTIVSRGYGARAGTQSDEAAELALLLPEVPHLANRNRVAAARTAAAAGARSIVVDDGFQHRRLARDLDIVAVDATAPFGCGHIFPRGLLREPLSGLARSHAVVLTRAALVDAARRAEIKRELGAACGGALPSIWVEAMHRPVALRTASGLTLPLDTMHSRRIVGFAGIGNPAAFRLSLERLGAAPTGFRAFADHHAYTPDDVTELAAWARGLGADMLVTTLKDLVKIGRDEFDGVTLVAVEIAMEMLSGADDLARLVASVHGPSADATSSSRGAACASATAANTS